MPRNNKATRVAPTIPNLRPARAVWRGRSGAVDLLAN